MTYLREPFKMLKPLSQCDMLRAKQGRNLTFFLETHTPALFLTELISGKKVGGNYETLVRY